MTSGAVVSFRVPANGRTSGGVVSNGLLTVGVLISLLWNFSAEGLFVDVQVRLQIGPIRIRQEPDVVRSR